MDFLLLVAMALALSLDALAATLSCSAAQHRLSLAHGLRMALLFGMFQGLMPVIGWALGRSLSGYLNDIDHWLAFGLLSAVGGHMIYSSRTNNDEPGHDASRLWVVLVLAVATSIDALAVGVSLTALHVGIALPALIIGLVTFVVCALGYVVGRYLGRRIRVDFEWLGGLVLIAIGCRILLDHLLSA